MLKESTFVPVILSREEFLDSTIGLVFSLTLFFLVKITLKFTFDPLDILTFARNYETMNVSLLRRIRCFL